MIWELLSIVVAYPLELQYILMCSLWIMMIIGMKLTNWRNQEHLYLISWNHLGIQLSSNSSFFAFSRIEHDWIMKTDKIRKKIEKLLENILNYNKSDLKAITYGLVFVTNGNYYSITNQI